MRPSAKAEGGPLGAVIPAYPVDDKAAGGLPAKPPPTRLPPLWSPNTDDKAAGGPLADVSATGSPLLWLPHPNNKVVGGPLSAMLPTCTTG